MEDIILYASKLLNLYTTVPTINSFLVQLWVRLSLPSCQVVMEDVEQRTLATLPVKPLFWKRYVDDVFSAVSANEAERLLSHFEFSGAIQFTLEREKDRHLPFLVCRAEQGNLETSVYRKPTHTDKYFAFDSQHPGLFAIKSL